MCETPEAKKAIHQYTWGILSNAMYTRARNICFHNHPAGPKERTWAKINTYAEAYGFQGRITIHEGRWSSTRKFPHETR